VNDGAAGGSDALLVGRIARAHGNRGQVIVNLDTDFPEARFAVGQVLRVEHDGRSQPRRIEAVRFHQGRPVIALQGLETIDDAEALAGAELKIDASELPPLPDGMFHHHDLVGCEVRDTSQRVLGTVVRVEGPMERSLLAVHAAAGDVLIPLAAEICVEVDPAARTIVVDPPEGLLELNGPAAPRR
jgi:16S rRNA processing protein RimM